MDHSDVLTTDRTEECMELGSFIRAIPRPGSWVTLRLRGIRAIAHCREWGMAMMLYGSLADSGLGAGQPLPECPDVVGSRAAAPSNYPRSLPAPPLGVLQVLLWVHGICLGGRAVVAGEMGVGAEGS